MALIPNHWHLLLWAHGDGELSDFVLWLTRTLTQRWHAHYCHLGTRHRYQGRFRWFPVHEARHFFQVRQYVERNALCAGLVNRAEQLRWGLLW